MEFRQSPASQVTALLTKVGGGEGCLLPGVAMQVFTWDLRAVSVPEHNIGLCEAPCQSHTCSVALRVTGKHAGLAPGS